MAFYKVAITCVCKVLYGLKQPLCCLTTIHRNLPDYLVSNSSHSKMHESMCTALLLNVLYSVLGLQVAS